MPKHYDQNCPVAKALELVGDRWTLLMVRDLLDEGSRRFQDFQQSLKGIAPAILSDRLKLMEEHGLVTRRFYSDHPPRAEYTLTDKGKAVLARAKKLVATKHEARLNELLGPANRVALLEMLSKIATEF